MKRLVIFLNNKLVSADSVLPVIYDVHLKSPEVLITFYCNRQSTMECIQRNSVVWDTINKIGKLKKFSGPVNNKIVRRTIALIRLLYLSLLTLKGSIRFIHFKELNMWPIKVLYFIAPKKTFLFQSTSGGHTDIELKIEDLMMKRRLSGMGLPVYKKVNKMSSGLTQVGGTFVGYYDNWKSFSGNNSNKVDELLVQLPITRKSWRQYIDISYDKYINSLGEFASKRFAVYILSSMDQSSFLSSKTTIKDLFSETLDIIIESNPNLPIVIKPHPATTEYYFQVINDIIKSKNVDNIIISEVHPMILAKNALFFIANSYSTTFTNAYIYNLPTIEYTSYPSEYLDVTDSKSMRPDLVTFFVNHNRQELKNILLGDFQNNLDLDEKSLFQKNTDLNNKLRIANYDELISKLIG